VSVPKLPAKRTIGKVEQLAIERRERDHRTARDRGYFFDEAEAARAARFFPRFCRHYEGQWAGKPLELLPYQADQVREIFGWKRHESGFRRFRTVYWEIPRKGGKTTLAGGVGLKLLVQDGEPGGQVRFTATKRDQALICHKAAGMMVRQSPSLRKYITVPKGFAHGGLLVCDRLNATAGVLSADGGTQDGLSLSGDIRDEVHMWKDHELAAVLDTSAGARRQPLTFEITTAGVYVPGSVGWTHHQYALEVLDQTVEDDTLFAYVTAADEGDDPFDPATWWKANPGLGTAPLLSEFAEQAEKAKKQPHFFNAFLRYRLNIWTRTLTRWLPMDRFRECDPTYTDPASMAGRPCWAALDLSSKLDLTALVLAWPEDDGTVRLWSRFYIPESRVGAPGGSLTERNQYPNWVRDGHLVATPGDLVDYEWIKRDLRELRAAGVEIQEIAYDAHGATATATDLSKDGFNMVEFGQGFKSMSEPSKDLEALVVSRNLRHGGNPVLGWCASNAVVKLDEAGNIKPDRKRSTEKIDGVIATVMALGRARGGTGGGYVASYMDQREMVTQ
jgi:phage terminase large subunit-like protein